MSGKKKAKNGEESDDETLQDVERVVDQDPPPKGLVEQVQFAIELTDVDTPGDIPPRDR